MFQLRKLFGAGPRADLKELVKNGAQIIDVRTENEYRGGNILGSINIPLQELSGKISKIRKDKPVITCCASGMRSATAKSFLAANGYSEVHNGGGWQSLQQKIS